MSIHTGRITVALATASIAALALAGCSGTPSDGDTAGGAEAPGTVLIISQPSGDPFGDLVFSGVEKAAQEQGIPSKQIAGVQAGAYEQQIRTAAQQGMNPITVLWDDLGNAAAKLAPDFPDTKFIIMDSTVDPGLPNVQNVTIESAQAAYIAGVVGSLLSDAKTVGFIGGQDIPVINTYQCGFEAGVKATEADTAVQSAYAGTFTDPQKGQDMAASMKSQGIDVIFQAANQTGLGVLKGAAANDQLGIGADFWQGDVAEGHVPWSALKDAGQAASHVVKDALTDKFTAGKFVFDASQGAALFDERDFDALDPAIQDAVTAAVDALKSGDITVGC